MSAEDQKAIAEFFERMKKLDAQRDPEAERQINELMERNPETKYYITQMAFFLEHAQAELQNKVRELEWKLQNQQPASQPAGGGGFLSNLFGGGGGRNVMPPPAPIHAPGYRPGMFSGGGGGFMSGALQTAAGVAGGMLLGNMLMSAFSPGIAEAAPVDDAAADDASATDAGYEQDAGYEEEIPQTDDFGGFEEL